MMSTSTAYGLFVPLLFLVACLVALLIALGPSILREVRPGRLGTGTAFVRSSALGLWLTRGLTLLRQTATLGGVVVVVVNLMVMAAGLALLFAPNDYTWAAFPHWLRSPADRITSGIGAIVTASTLGLAVLLSRVQGVARSIRPALDVMLDVDNYLRTRPENGPPRALMFARFASLLRYLTHWHREGRKYDAIVFVAHSQGSMIVLEALRYHQNVGFVDVHPDLAGIPRYLLTMGSPIRQLYARAFPTLYEWTSRELSADAIKLSAWINLYRSGDYVGRSMWHQPGDPTTYGEGGQGTPCGLEECLGEGAHVHYWDLHAGDVGSVLDGLVVHAIERA